MNIMLQNIKQKEIYVVFLISMLTLSTNNISIIH